MHHQEIKDSDYHPTLYKKEMKQLLKPYAAHVLWQKPLNSRKLLNTETKDRWLETESSYSHYC